MKNTLIYDDEGVSLQSVAALKATFDAHSVRGELLRQSDWISETNLLIMPGGRSAPFYKTLGDQGNANIIQFVKEGGCYLGLCAGAYYAARKTAFARGLPHEIILEGGLNFFEGEAIGPAFSAPEFAYASEAGASVVTVVLDQKSYPVYFNGGCYFSENPFSVASYAKTGLCAIVSFRFGLGHVVLSGVHPELDFKTIPEDENPHHRLLRETLYNHDAKRRELLVKIRQQCYPC